MAGTARTYFLIFGLYNVSWSFLGPVYALFLLSRGLDVFEINVVFAVYLITAFVFEVPTGAVADRAGRKVSFLLSCAVRATAFAMYAGADSFADCLVAEVVDAIGSTLASGALDAWAVDGVQADGDRRPIERVFARAHLVSRGLMILSALVGGYLGQRDLRWPWVAGAAGFVLTGAAAALLMRESREGQAQTHAAGTWVGASVRQAFRAVRASPVLLLLCLMTGAAAFATMPVYQTWQPRLQGLTGEGAALMGWVAALLNVASMAGSAIVPRLVGRAGRAGVVALMLAGRGLMIAVAALAPSLAPAVAGLLLLELGFAVSEPLVQAWMNDHVGGAQRATVLSVRAMAFTLGGGIGLLCLGLLARNAGIAAAWLVAAGVLVTASGTFLACARRLDHAPPPPAGVGAAPSLPV